MIINTIVLDAGKGLKLVMDDRTQHYFGGYFHVKVSVYCEVKVDSIYFDTAEEFDAARKKLGESVKFERELSKMAVAESDIVKVRSELIEAFNSSALAYITEQGFARRFLHSELLKRVGKPSKSMVARA